MKPRLLIAAGVLTAILVTSTMDATGLFAFSALPLCPLMILYCFLWRVPPAEIGFRWAGARGALLAAGYPLAVVGLLTVLAFAGGAVDAHAANWQKAMLNLLILSVATFVLAMVTEEGFFRGWLWAVLSRTGLSRVGVLLSTSIAFMLWHISAVAFDTSFRPTPVEIAVFLVNATLLGLTWGAMRMLTGSIVVTSISHGIWNGLVYVLFGFGKSHGALGVQNSLLYGPELGIAGLLLNGIAAVAIGTLAIRRGPHSGGRADSL